MHIELNQHKCDFILELTLLKHDFILELTLLKYDLILELTLHKHDFILANYICRDPVYKESFWGMYYNSTATLCRKSADNM